MCQYCSQLFVNKRRLIRDTRGHCVYVYAFTSGLSTVEFLLNIVGLYEFPPPPIMGRGRKELWIKLPDLRLVRVCENAEMRSGACRELSGVLVGL